MVPECLQVMHYCACAQMWPHCLFFISCPVGLCHCDVDLLNHIEKIGILAKKKKKKSCSKCLTQLQVSPALQ